MSIEFRFARDRRLRWAIVSVGIVFAIFLLANVAMRSIAADPEHLHWSFAGIRYQKIPSPLDLAATQSPIDCFVQNELKGHGLVLAPMANRAALIRRLTFVLTGLPPTAEEMDAFTEDRRDDAVERLADRLMASPRYGERWGKYWLDVAGYADSNGYFNADSDRPLAHHYRDYVIRSLNSDKPFNEFVREQIAGDELAKLPAIESGKTLEFPESSDHSIDRLRELIAATHFLRNAQDGTSESDGNPDEQTIDRATVLEGCVQITVNSLLALTIQCARCHDHKFEPIGQDEYYGLQSVFYPVFPAYHPDRWIKPKDRFAFVVSTRERQDWETRKVAAQSQLMQLRNEFRQWWNANRPADMLLFGDDFDSEVVPSNWSNTVPGDDQPSGTPPVELNGKTAPAAVVRAMRSSSWKAARLEIAGCRLKSVSTGRPKSPVTGFR